MVTAKPRKNMQPLAEEKAKILKRVRFKIDWVIGLLSQVFHVQRTLSKTMHRTSFILAAFNLGVWINSSLKRPLFSIKPLPA